MVWSVGSEALNLTLSPILRERRRFQRVKVDLPGRYMLADKREYPCRTLDMSPGGVALFAPVRSANGTRIIAYIDEIGRLEGVIARPLATGFAFSFDCTPPRREKLADQLTWLANRALLGLPEDREHSRITPFRSRVLLQLADGSQYSAEIIDASRSGAALKCEVRPPIGARVALGHSQATVVRHFATGVALRFAQTIDSEKFDEHVVF